MGVDFDWDRLDPQIRLILFVNAADSTGVSIGNLRANDEINVTEMAGDAEFDADAGNSGLFSIAALLLSLTEAVTVGAGHPEFKGPISELENIARQAFGMKGQPKKVRDAFGLSDGGTHKARQEGGVILSLPGSQGPYQSGKSQELWIKNDGERTDANRPDHVVHGFFPRRHAPEHNRRQLAQSGRLFVTAWDWNYPDNTGYYKVYMTITRP